MPDSQQSQPSASSDEAKGAIDQLKPIPDEDGPHDVPDDKVIEKTLPAVKVGDDGGRPS